MITVAEVRTRPNNSLEYFKIDDNITKDLTDQDFLVVETTKGYDITKFIQIKQMKKNSLTDELLDVIRKADEIDLAEFNDLEKAEEVVRLEVRKIVDDLSLEMKISKAHYGFDLEDLTIFYEANGRVDFRELVKILNNKYNRRIELRQIGARDTAKLLGGVGPCGLILCCSTFIGEFDIISIKMAKNQNLSLAPQRISGLCGKLLCCIKFEEEVYEELNKTLPDYGTKVITEIGEGTVIGVSVLKQKVRIRDENTSGINWLDVKDVSFKIEDRRR